MAVPSHRQTGILVELTGSGSDRIRKELHAGDPDLYLPYRPSQDGQASLSLTRSPGSSPSPIEVSASSGRASALESDRSAIEAEPNDSWRQANELRLGRDVYGSADDVDYLENHERGQVGSRLVPVPGG